MCRTCNPNVHTPGRAVQRLSFRYSEQAARRDGGAEGGSLCSSWHMRNSLSARGRQSRGRSRRGYRRSSSGVSSVVRKLNQVSMFRFGTATTTRSSSVLGGTLLRRHSASSHARVPSVVRASASITTRSHAPCRARIALSSFGNCVRTHCSPDCRPSGSGKVYTSRPRILRCERKRRTKISVWLSSQSKTKRLLTGASPERSSPKGRARQPSDLADR